ncbi:MAG: MinD/ParA family protein [Gammaproteobacteria bacterium]|nr:MAG: MinD/ParA family protein [Gammaproteobacteria bacterium]
MESRGHLTRVIAVSGGKGGVGKTSVSVNLGIALAGLGRRVVLLDADLGLANVDIMLGLRPQHNLAEVMDGQVELPEILVETGFERFRVVPGASGIQKMAALSPAEHAGLVYAFSELGNDTDILIVDTAAGISDSTISFCAAAHEVLIVLCNDPASLTDAYALIKILSQERGCHRFRVLTNMVHSAAEGRQLYNKLVAVADRYLDVTLDHVGTIPRDLNMQRAVRRQQPLPRAYPGSPATAAFKKLAERADNWSTPRRPSGGMQFFVEQLVGGEAGLERRARA